MPANIYLQTAKTLRKILKQATWWNLVQDEVKKKVGFVLDNFDVLAPVFKDTFTNLFKYESMRRSLEKKSIHLGTPGVLFGSSMNEEVYQSGKIPTRVLLNLNDWVEPNEADVQVCFAICNHLEYLSETSNKLCEESKKLLEDTKKILEENENNS